MIENSEEIIDILFQGGVIAYVTDTVWGLGCLPYNEKAVKKIYEIKKREAQKPLILMSNSLINLKKYIKDYSPQVKELAEKYFPGALTIVTEKSDLTPDFVTSNLETVGIRIPNNEVFKELCELIPGHVLATTSANLSHQPSAVTYEQTVENMREFVDFIIPDYGFTANGIESTVVGVMNNQIKIFRQGAVEI